MKKLLLLLLTSVSLTSIGYSQTNTTSNDTGFTSVTNQSVPLSTAVKSILQTVTSGTNWVFIGGYGHSVQGRNNLAFFDGAYNFNDNVGIVIGYDYLWTSGAHEANDVKGGVNLQTTIHPFSFVGSTFLTNVIATPFVADLLATPENGNAIGNIVTTGINFDLYDFNRFSIDGGVQYENRSGQGNWDGNYGLIHLAFSRKF